MKPQHDRRGGGERRSGLDRRKAVSFAVTRKRGAPAAAGVAGTVTTYAAALLSEKYGVPMEVMAPIVGVVSGLLTAIYNKFVLPWLE